jgi:hypothetical protein
MRMPQSSTRGRQAADAKLRPACQTACSNRTRLAEAQAAESYLRAGAADVKPSKRRDRSRDCLPLASWNGRRPPAGATPRQACQTHAETRRRRATAQPHPLPATYLLRPRHRPTATPRGKAPVHTHTPNARCRGRQAKQAKGPQPRLPAPCELVPKTSSGGCNNAHGMPKACTNLALNASTGVGCPPTCQFWGWHPPTWTLVQVAGDPPSTPRRQAAEA